MSPPPGVYASKKSEKWLEKFDPQSTVFPCVDGIPTDLLSMVATCFKQRLLVCRICFFESHCTELSSKREGRGTCEKGHPWRQIRVIPKCELCLGPGPFIPIPSMPKHMQHSHSPFMVCKKTDHNTCYYMSKNTNPWFPHTVEELVIWTVERERGMYIWSAIVFHCVLLEY